MTHSRELEESKEEEKKDLARTELEVAGRKSMTSIQVSPHLGPRPSLLIEVENDNGDVQTEEFDDLPKFNSHVSEPLRIR